VPSAPLVRPARSLILLIAFCQPCSAAFMAFSVASLAAAISGETCCSTFCCLRRELDDATGLKGIRARCAKAAAGLGLELFLYRCEATFRIAEEKQAENRP
jgi:hypothetical protein